MMICDNINLKENDMKNIDNTTSKADIVSVPNHCNGICKFVILMLFFFFINI